MVIVNMLTNSMWKHAEGSHCDLLCHCVNYSVRVLMTLTPLAKCYKHFTAVIYSDSK